MKRRILPLSILFSSLMPLMSCQEQRTQSSSTLMDTASASNLQLRYEWDDTGEMRFHALIDGKEPGAGTRIELQNCSSMNHARALFYLPPWNSEITEELFGLTEAEAEAYPLQRNAAISCSNSGDKNWAIAAVYSGFPDFFVKIRQSEADSEFLWAKIPGHCNRIIELSGLGNFLGKNRSSLLEPTPEMLGNSPVLTFQCSLPDNDLPLPLPEFEGWVARYEELYLASPDEANTGVIKLSRGGHGFGVLAIDGVSVSPVVKDILLNADLEDSERREKFAQKSAAFTGISSQFQLNPGLDNYEAWTYSDDTILLEDSEHTKNAPILSLCFKQCPAKWKGRHVYLSNTVKVVEGEKVFEKVYKPVRTLDAQSYLSKRPESFGRKLIRWVYGDDGETLILDAENESLLLAMNLRISEAPVAEFKSEADQVLLGEAMPDNFISEDLAQVSRICSVYAANLSQLKREISLQCRRPFNSLTIHVLGDFVLDRPLIIDQASYPDLKSFEMLGSADSKLIYAPSCGQGCLDKISLSTAAIKVKDRIKLILRNLSLRLDKVEPSFPSNYRTRAIEASNALLVLDGTHLVKVDSDRGFDVGIHARLKTTSLLRGSSILSTSTTIDTDYLGYVLPSWGNATVLSSNLESTNGTAVNLFGPSAQFFVDTGEIKSPNTGVGLIRGAKSFFHKTKILGSGTNNATGLSNALSLEGSEAIFDSSEVKNFRSAFLVNYDATSSSAQPSKVSSRATKYCVRGPLVSGASAKLTLQPAGLRPSTQCQP